MSYWETGSWGLRKYTILRKYLKACEKFSNIYHNFSYVETHGGSGKVRLKSSGELEDGSPLIAGQWSPSFPCQIIEIDSKRYSMLKSSVMHLPHVKAIRGDCNVYIDQVLASINSWHFSFFFIDPDGLTYYDTSHQKFDQLTASTVDKIASRNKSEVMVNFPLEGILRCGGYAAKRPTDSKSKSFDEDLTKFFGKPSWKNTPLDGSNLLRLYVDLRLKPYYPYVGAIMIRNEQNSPQYYLIYGSKNRVGGEIMRNVMKTEWIAMRNGVYPLTKNLYDTEKKWLDAEFPLDFFVFETIT